MVLDPTPTNHLSWSSMAIEEEEWIRTQGLDSAPPDNRVRGVWSRPSFLRYLGRSKDHNARSDLPPGNPCRRKTWIELHADFDHLDTREYTEGLNIKKSQNWLGFVHLVLLVKAMLYLSTRTSQSALSLASWFILTLPYIAINQKKDYGKTRKTYKRSAGK